MLPLTDVSLLFSRFYFFALVVGWLQVYIHEYIGGANDTLARLCDKAQGIYKAMFITFVALKLVYTFIHYIRGDVI